MNHKKGKNTTPDQLNKVFELVEDSLRAENILLPTEETHYREEVEILSLPEHLRDPMAVLKRGQEVLANGLNVHVVDKQDDLIENRLAQAARNGSQIPSDILDRMHEDRDSVESDSNG